MGKWKLIKTAPRDGKPVLLYTTCHGQVEAWFCPAETSVDHEGMDNSTGPVWVCADDAFQIEVEQCGPGADDNDYHHGTATHWMDLPAPPFSGISRPSDSTDSKVTVEREGE